MEIAKTDSGYTINAGSAGDMAALERFFGAAGRQGYKSEPPSKYIHIGIDTLADIERKVILDTLKFFHGNKRRTADVLGISLKTIYNKLESYGTR